MSYVTVNGFGADAVDVQAQAQAIQASNDALTRKYEADLNSYQNAMAARQALIEQIAREQAQYKSAALSYQQKVAAVQSANAGAQAGYNAALAAWQRAKSAYDAAVAQRMSIAASNSATAAGVFRGGAPTPPDYASFQAQGYCYTQAQHDDHVQRCSAGSIVVRGTDLGRLFALSGTVPDCQWVNLPVCRTVALPPAPGTQPTPPPALSLPGGAPTPPPVRVVPPEPTPPMKPVLQVVPQVVVSPKGFTAAGLLALVLVGGGVAYYYTTHKKKAAA